MMPTAHPPTGLHILLACPRPPSPVSRKHPRLGLSRREECGAPNPQRRMQRIRRGRQSRQHHDLSHSLRRLTLRQRADHLPQPVLKAANEADGERHIHNDNNSTKRSTAPPPVGNSQSGPPRSLGQHGAVPQLTSFECLKTIGTIGAPPP